MRASFLLLLLCGLLPFFLTGCMTSKTDVTGLCGSCKPYYVRGSMHYPQKHYEYDEEGLASWYGPGFHGKPKPLGERYNQHEMTAAHKTLPLPTIAKVTNLETGKAVIVLIDDRGPFVYKGRIIDLSMEAAKRLGTFAKGTTRVRVQSLVEESKALADYLARHGHHMHKDKLKRTWLQIYEQEIKKNKAVGSHMPKACPVEQPLAPPLKKLRFKKQVLTNVSLKNKSQCQASNIKKAASQSTSVTDTLILKKTYTSQNDAIQAVKKLSRIAPAKSVKKLGKKGRYAWQIKVGPFKSKLQQRQVQKLITQMESQ